MLLLKKGIADLRERKLQSLLVFVIVAAAAAVGVLAVSVTQAASSTYESVLEQAHGGHAWLLSDDPTALKQLGTMSGVESTTGPIARAGATLTSTPDTYPLFVWAMNGGPMPSVAPTLIREGHWLDGGANEAVIDRGLATKAGLKVGDNITIVGDGGSRSVGVVGIGIHTTRPPYPLSDPADVFTTPDVVTAVSGGKLVGYVSGVRLEDPNATGAFIAAYAARDPAFTDAMTWQNIRDDVSSGDEALVVLLRTFAVFAFFAVGFVLANTVSGQVLSQYREIGLLRAIGLAPRQVTLMLLAEHLALALLAAIVGAFLGVFATPLLLTRVAGLLDATPSEPFHPTAIAFVVLAVVAEVLLFTLLPAWRGGRVSIVQALTVGPSHAANRPSRLIGWIERLRLPASVTIGVKDLFSRPGRTWLSIAALTLAFATVASGLTVEATGRAISSDPLRIGRPPYQLELSATAPESATHLTDAAVLGAANAAPGVASTLTFQRLPGSVDGHDYFPVDAVGGDIADMPYPIKAGRMVAAPGEAVIGLNVQRDQQLHVGDPFTLSLLHGPQIPLKVVGVVASEDNNGHTVLYSLQDLMAAAPRLITQPSTVALRLRPGVDSKATALAIRQATDGGVLIVNVEAKFRSDLASRTHDLRSVTIPLTSSLIVIALINLVSTLAFAIRERIPEFGILKTIGYTPRQIYLSVGLTSGILATIAAALGAPLGYFVTAALVNNFGEQGGWPAGVAATPPLLWVTVALPLVLAGVLLVSAFPARTAARIAVAEALRFE